MNSVSMAYIEKYQNYTTGVPLAFLRQFDHTLTQLDGSAGTILFTATTMILVISLFIGLSILFIAATLDDIKTMENPSIIKQIFCVILVGFKSFLYMPVLDLLFRTLLAVSMDSSLSSNQMIARYFISGLTIAIYLALTMYLLRLFNLYLPTD